MEMTDAKVVEKKIYEEGKKHDDYASKATGNAGLTLGIIGTALGAGAWLFGGNRSVFGSLGGNMRETDIAEKFSMYKGANDAINAENRRAMQAEFGLYKSQIDADFGLYKNQRDQYDALQAKYSDLDKKVAVMEALTPYKEKLMMAYVNEKTCNCLRGQLVLPSTPVISGYGSYCCNGTAPSTPTTGA